jgi:hypothetical protein
MLSVRGRSKSSVIPCWSKKLMSESRSATDDRVCCIYSNEICHVIMIEFFASPFPCIWSCFPLSYMPSFSTYTFIFVDGTLLAAIAASNALSTSPIKRSGPYLWADAGHVPLGRVAVWGRLSSWGLEMSTTRWTIVREKTMLSAKCRFDS